MSSPAEYLESLAARLSRDSCQPRWEDWNGAGVLVGRRAAFPPPWMGRLHLFTVAAAFPEVTVATVTTFAVSAQRYVQDKKGGLLLPGLGYVLVVFPCLVSDRVAPDVLATAGSRRMVEMGIETRPVVVDTARGVVGVFRNPKFVGAAFAGYLRGKIQLYFDGALEGTGSPDAAGRGS